VNTRFHNGRFFNSGFFPVFGFGYGYGGYYGGYPYYPYYDSSYYDPYGYYDPGYYAGAYGYAGGYDGYAGYPVAAAPTVINQSIAAPPEGYYRAADYYLIAFNDHTIQAAISFTVVGDTLRFITRQNEQKMAPLSSVDVRFSEQINRDRRVDFRLQ
jgi:hypothetical protein